METDILTSRVSVAEAHQKLRWYRKRKGRRGSLRDWSLERTSTSPGGPLITRGSSEYPAVPTTRNRRRWLCVDHLDVPLHKSLPCISWQHAINSPNPLSRFSVSTYDLLSVPLFLFVCHLILSVRRIFSMPRRLCFPASYMHFSMCLWIAPLLVKGPGSVLFKLWSAVPRRLGYRAADWHPKL